MLVLAGLARPKNKVIVLPRIAKTALSSWWIAEKAVTMLAQLCSAMLSYALRLATLGVARLRSATLGYARLRLAMLGYAQLCSATLSYALTLKKFEMTRTSTRKAVSRAAAWLRPAANNVPYWYF